MEHQEQLPYTFRNQPVVRLQELMGLEDGTWRQFDLVPEEYETRECQADYTGRICVIGTDLKEEDLMKLFHL